MTDDQAPPPGASIMLKVLISRVAAELFGMAADLKAVQDSLDIATTKFDVSADQIIVLQKLDVTEQTLRALAEVGALVSSVVPAGLDIVSADVLSTCRLSSLVDRLMGLTRPEPIAIELF